MRQQSGKTGICDGKMIQFMPANHSNTNRVITILIHSNILESPNFDGVTFDLLTFANKTNIF